MGLLHEAVAVGDTMKVEELLRKGEHPGEEDDNGISAFSLAIALGYKDIRDLFLIVLGYPTPRYSKYAQEDQRRQAQMGHTTETRETILDDAMKQQQGPAVKFSFGARRR
ncbi:ankyrin repeat domain-containing protein [Candidatus Magnetobacterium casense]|uniref:Ankyrin repeat protein n=1 Tax=Candidatus Magnetobacterium casense TaxID=1455061 RepID=A0ABS6RYF3_9BACT|nr:ankyrin repeat domain-containing protein [Candidatus Magnetobacterium casensis]MBV6341064.1 hypothetical protein [Candidatus Magnetobacterium casensis]